MNRTRFLKKPSGMIRLVFATAGYVLLFFLAAFMWSEMRQRAGVSIWHPSSGLSFGMLLFFGSRLAPVVFLTELAAWVFIFDMPFGMGGLAILMLSTVAYTTAAVVLRRLVPDKGQSVSLREASLFLFAAVILALTVAYLTAKLMVQAHIISAIFVQKAMIQFLMRQALSNVVFAPLVLLILTSITSPSIFGFAGKARGKTSTWKALFAPYNSTERGIMLLHLSAVVLLGWTAFALYLSHDWRAWFMVFLPLVLIIYHYGMRGAIIAAFLINAAAIGVSVLFHYAPAEYENQMLFLVLLSMASLMMGAAFSEGRDAERALRYRLGIEETITAISSRFINLRSEQVDAEIQRALGEICAYCGVDAGHLFLFGRDFQIERVYEWVEEGQPSRVGLLEGSSMTSLPWLLGELKAGNVVRMLDWNDLPDAADAERAHFVRNQLRSLVTVPLQMNNTLVGSLGFHSQQMGKNWTDEDIRMLRLLSQIFLGVIERTRAEARIRESDLKFRSLVLQSYDGVLLVDGSGRLTEWNRGMERITGLRRSETQGRFIWDVQLSMAPIAKRTNRLLEQVRSEVLQMLASGESKVFNRVRDYELVRPDGKTRLVESLVFPINTSGGIMLGSFVRDITDVRLSAEELRRSQANLAEAEHLAQLGHFRMDLADGSMEWSEETYRIAMIDPDTEPPSLQQIIPYLAAEDRERMTEAIRLLIEKKQRVTLDYSVEIPDGPRKNFVSVLRPEIGPDGAVKQIFGTVMDITVRKEAEEALRESELRYRELADAVSDYFFGLDWEMKVTYWNPASEMFTGFRASDVIGKDLYEVFPDLRGSSAEQFALEAFRTRMHQGFVLEWRASKRLHYLEVNVYPGRNGVSVFMRDVTERHLAEERLRQSEARYRAVVEDQADLISRFTPDGTMTFVNEAYCRVLGINRSDVIGKRFYTINVSFDERELRGEHCMLAGSDQALVYETRAILADGKEHWIQWMDRPILDDLNRVVEYQSVGRDISESKRLEEELRYMSTHDMLTGIYNRAFFETELKRLERSRLYPISILMVDVNGLKSTNDTQGHASGDELLQTAAQVLSACFRPEDIVARFGGDEFAVLLPGLDETAAADVLARVRASQDRYNQSSTNFNLSLSIGISTADKGDTLLDVLSKADRQMYLDKGRQKGTRELNGRGN